MCMERGNMSPPVRGYPCGCIDGRVLKYKTASRHSARVSEQGQPHEGQSVPKNMSTSRLFEQFLA